jgi:uncharacterized protein related to proFAR isomerase
MDIVELPDLSNGFSIIPSLAVMGKTPVWVREDKYNPIRFGKRTVSPESITMALSKKFDIIHYLDITGIRKGKVEWNTFQAVVDSSKEVWADVGITFADSVIDPLMSGAANGIITTKMIHSIEEIAAAYELTENILLQIDHDEGIVAKDPVIKEMDPGDLIREMSSFGMDSFIIDYIRSGRSSPPRSLTTKLLGALPSGGRLFVGAGELSDLRTLDDLGVDGAIISVSRLMRGYS